MAGDAERIGGLTARVDRLEEDRRDLQGSLKSLETQLSGEIKAVRETVTAEIGALTEKLLNSTAWNRRCSKEDCPHDSGERRRKSDSGAHRRPSKATTVTVLLGVVVLLGEALNRMLGWTSQLIEIIAEWVRHGGPGSPTGGP